MSKTETLNLRVSAEFKKRLVEEAAREKRSVTNYLEATLSAIWEQKDDGEGKGKGKRS
jgi:predicted HicB family RNase H-like nuclease